MVPEKNIGEGDKKDINHGPRVPRRRKGGLSPDLRRVLKGIGEQAEIDAAKDASLEEGIVTSEEEIREVKDSKDNPK